MEQQQQNAVKGNMKWSKLFSTIGKMKGKCRCCFQHFAKKVCLGKCSFFCLPCLIEVHRKNPKKNIDWDTERKTLKEYVSINRWCLSIIWLSIVTLDTIEPNKHTIEQ